MKVARHVMLSSLAAVFFNPLAVVAIRRGTLYCNGIGTCNTSQCPTNVGDVYNYCAAQVIIKLLCYMYQ
ncbi:hypothetical protein BUE80_DR000468 [Diplocarpon rosae]|nr:hypothetical protein BUE80_DR000468 [Diplocarpon rosae]